MRVPRTYTLSGLLPSCRGVLCACPFPVNRQVSSFEKPGTGARGRRTQDGSETEDVRSGAPEVMSSGPALAATSATRPGSSGDARQGARDGTQRPPVPAWHQWSHKDTARWQDALSRDFTVNA